MSDVTQTVELQEVPGGRFKTGNIGGPGRPKGARNKLGEAMISDLWEDWKRYGIQAITEVRERSPVDYLKIVAMLVSKCDDLRLSMVDSVHAEELEAIIEERRRRAMLEIEKMSWE